MDRWEEQRVLVADPNVITEKAFAKSHQSFWRGVAPMMTRYVRFHNLSPSRQWPSLADTPVDNRGVINELGFRIFDRARRNGCAPSDLQVAVLQECALGSVSFIQRFRTFGRPSPVPPDEEGIREAVVLAERLTEFFSVSVQPVRVWPEFPGCGWLDLAQGDALAEGTLFEVKSGDSPLRGQDLRQVLCYLALNLAAGSFDVHSVCILNPRTGLFYEDSVEGLCRGISGRGSAQVLGEIVSYISEPSWSTALRS